MRPHESHMITPDPTGKRRTRSPLHMTMPPTWHLGYNPEPHAETCQHNPKIKRSTPVHMPESHQESSPAQLFKLYTRSHQDYPENVSWAACASKHLIGGNLGIIIQIMPKFHQHQQLKWSHKFITCQTWGARCHAPSEISTGNDHRSTKTDLNFPPCSIIITWTYIHGLTLKSYCKNHYSVRAQVKAPKGSN